MDYTGVEKFYYSKVITDQIRAAKVGNVLV